MEEERICSECEKSDVKLYDCILNGFPILLCNSCAELNDAIIIKKPSVSQIAESEKPYTVYERLGKALGMEKSDLEEMRKESDRKRVEQVAREMKRRAIEREEKIIKLVDNFEKILNKERNFRGMTQKQLALAILEPETAINMLENGDIPEDAEKLLKKLEQFLRIRLIEEEPEEEKKEAPKEKEMENKSEWLEDPEKPFDLNQNITIGKLKEIKEQKVEETIKQREENLKIHAENIVSEVVSEDSGEDKEEKENKQNIEEK